MLIEDLFSQRRLLTRDFRVAYYLAQVVARPQEEKALKTQGEPVIDDALEYLASLDSNGVRLGLHRMERGRTTLPTRTG